MKETKPLVRVRYCIVSPHIKQETVGDRGSPEEVTGTTTAAATTGGEADNTSDAVWIQKNPLPAYAALNERLRQGNKLVQSVFPRAKRYLHTWGKF